METSVRDQPSATRALLCALLAASVMGLGIALAQQIGHLFASEGFTGRFVSAVAVTAVVVPVIAVLLRRWDRRPLREIGLTGMRADLRGAFLGIGVVLGCAAVVLALIFALGMVDRVHVDTGRLAAFLVSNAVIALLAEAIPEEIAIRGYALSSLRRRFGRTATTVLTTVTFLLVPLIALAGTTGGGLIAGDADTRFTLAPPGEDPVMYYMMLAVFGLMLVYAREATTAASVWTCVGAHIAWLTVNRLVLGGEETGVDMHVSGAGVSIFLGGYVTLSIVAFGLLRARADERRTRPLPE